MVRLMLCLASFLFHSAALSPCPISGHWQSISPSFSACLLLWAVISSMSASQRVFLEEVGNSLKQSKSSRRPISRSWWCCGQAPKGPQLLLLFASWSIVVLLFCIPSLVKGSDIRQQEYGKYDLSGDSARTQKIRISKPDKALNVEPEGRSRTPDSGASDGDTWDSTRVPCPAQTGFGFPTPETSSASSTESLSGAAQSIRTKGSAAPNIAIFPPFLEWGERPLFSPSPLSVTIMNLCNNTWLRLFHPFSSDMQFYAAGFKESLVAPGEEFVMRIVFLPKAVGIVEGMVIIQTSAGGFLVQVQGRGIGSPYQLKPFQQLNVAVGQSLQTSIFIYNPYDGLVKMNEVHAWPVDFDNRTLVLTNPVNDNVGVSKCCSDSVSGVCGCIAHSNTVQGDEGTFFSLKPAGSWEISSCSSSEVVEFEFKAVKVGKWNAFVYIRLSFDKPTGPGSDEIVLPITVTVYRTPDVLPGLQLLPEVSNFGYFTSRKQERKQAISLRNMGHEFVQIKQISHSSGGDRNLVMVRYKQGHVIPPGTETQVAVMWYRGIEESLPFENHARSADFRLKLIIHTNSSENEYIEVPYHAVVLHGSESSQSFEETEADETNVERVFFENGFNVQLSAFEELERKLFGREVIESGILPSGQLELTEEDELQLVVPRARLSVLLKTNLVFPTVQIGSSEALWVNVTNLSDEPLSLQLVLSHEAEASNCRSFSKVAGYSTGESGKTTNVFVVPEDGAIDLVVRAHEDGALGPVVFQPSKRCRWTGLLLVRNNLTLVEWMPVQGIGSSAELSILDNNLPVEALQLVGTVQLLSAVTGERNEELSSLSGKRKAVTCNQRVNRSFVAKNTGDLPLRVHSVGLVNGGCSSHGFEIGLCDGFSLAAGEIAHLKLSYKPDYGVAQVRHNLQLVTSIGTVNMPVVVVLPDYLFRLCANIPVYFKYRKLILHLGILSLVCLMIVIPRFRSQDKLLFDSQWPSNGEQNLLPSKDLRLPTKVGNKEFKGVENTSLPIFREANHSPPVLSDDCSSPPNLSKIRVKVTEEDSEEIVAAAVHVQQGGDGSDMVGKRSTSSEPAIETNVFPAMKQQQFHSAVSMSPTSSPRKVSKSQQEKAKRKKKKGPLSTVKQEAARSGASSPTSSPASPATPLSPQGPVSPLLTSEAEVKTSSTPGFQPLSRLDVEVGRRMSSASSTAVSSAHWVPKHARKEGLRLDIVGIQNAGGGSIPELNLKGQQQQQHGRGKHHQSLRTTNAGTLVTVARKTGSTVTDKAVAEAEESKTTTTVQKKGGMGPLLTQSASFPRSGRSSGWNIPLLESDITDSSNTLFQPQISPSARAPGTRITKHDNSSRSNNVHLSASVLNSLQGNLETGALSKDCSNNSSGRFSRDDSEDYLDAADMEHDANGGLVYDIWGDHFGEISRQNQPFVPRNVHSGNEDGTQSLFSVPAFSVLKQDLVEAPAAAAAAPATADTSSTPYEFSMFSHGNPALAAFNIPPKTEVGDEEVSSPSYFILSPFDLTYSKHIHFPQGVSPSINLNC